MATIKPIEGRSVHQIQSGQVIGDGLSSAVKELVENSFDAHATSIEVRFKNYGLDSLEVTDNGDGVTRENYENIALKHYTSKLTSYDDLENVQTFGFRGEALSSLCALSLLTIITATKDDAPKGSKLEFEISGKLKNVSVVAAQKGTTVISENLFRTLPVRRKELERNIKREYTKVLGLLQAYASIKTGVKFAVFNQPPKGKKTLVFATKANPTIRENISNVFGAKTLNALVSLDLDFEMQSKPRPAISAWTNKGEESKLVKIIGHISKPVVGEGRLAPDRQMFFVNQRPCNLPQVSRAFNEVYKQFNMTQSPFIFADLQLDTNAYDVNVSPDKRTILLHDQNELLESLKVSLTELFNNHEQYVPHTQLGIQNKLPGSKPPMLQKSRTGSSPTSSSLGLEENTAAGIDNEEEAMDLPNEVSSPTNSLINRLTAKSASDKDSLKSIIAKASSMQHIIPEKLNHNNLHSISTGTPSFNSDLEEEEEKEDDIFPSSPPGDRIPPYRSSQRADPEPATITIGNKTIISTGTSPARKRQRINAPQAQGQKGLSGAKDPSTSRLLSMLRNLAAPGTQAQNFPADESDDENMSDKIENLTTSELDEEGSNSQELISNSGSTVPIKTEGIDEDDSLYLPRRRESKEREDQAKNEVEELEGNDNGFIEGHSDLNEDDEYIDEEELRVREKRKVEQLIKEAEAHTAKPSVENKARAERLLKGRPQGSIKGRTQTVSASIDGIKQYSGNIKKIADEYTYIHRIQHSQGATKDILDQSPEERLTLTISKSDFARMRIIGQFNRGFIITTRSTPANDFSKGSEDLFIIDQHASDEKYNFETLQATTVMQSQPLVRPKTLELMAMDEEIVKDNLHTLKANGFSVEVDEDAPSGQKCKLLTLPMSENTVFDLRDLEELIHLMSDGSGGNNEDGGFTKGKGKATVIRPSKVRKTFAMRACRSSIMVGKALTVEQMKKIVRHMGELDKPWNCPHGRPTMRHLCDLGQMESWNGDLQYGMQCQWKGGIWEEYISDYRAMDDEDDGEEEALEE